MRSLIAAGLVVVAVSGCAMGPQWTPQPQPLAVYYENPVFLPVADPQAAWETVVDVVDDYFKPKREEPVRLIGNTLTEGRLDTFPEVGATLLEPWRSDSVGTYERLESTLQSIRRQAVVRVVPARGGYWVDVAVLKELEDLPRPEQSTAGAATFRYDDSLTRVVNPALGQEITRGWIPQGRDTALEQQILGQLRQRSGQPLIRTQSPETEEPASAPQQRTARYGDESLLPGPGCEICSTLPLGQFVADTLFDYQQFYSFPSLELVALGLGAGAVLANTALDEDFQQWHDDRVQTRDTNRFSARVKRLGNGWIMIPVFAGAALVGPQFQGRPEFEVVGEWGSRCLRSVLVGAPPVLILQWGLGAARPSAEAGSHWRPFHSNHSVSGHAFIGATVFINAAKMTENVPLKLAFYSASVLPAWSRVNDRQHFLSQAFLGWWFAYLAATAVDNTEHAKREFRIVPMDVDDTVGAAVLWAW